MKNRLINLISSPVFLLHIVVAAQNPQIFTSDIPLEVTLNFDRKELLERTNDSTYMPTTVELYSGDETYTIQAHIRSRGDYRKKNCFYIPLKLKFEAARTKGTPLEGVSKFKLVLPCMLEEGNDDALIKEYMAYKIYERLMPYHFRTKLIDVRWKDTGRRRSRDYQVKAFMLEDIDETARRYHSKEIKRMIPPQQQDDTTAVGLAYFEFLIANTDFSMRGRHNIKLLFKEGRILPIPFDFDLSGMVNASYAEVSGIRNISKRIDDVTQRAYKGYLRDEGVMQAMRQYFLEQKDDVLSVIMAHEGLFRDTRTTGTMIQFVTDFYKILENDKKFERQILNHARK